MDPEMMDPAEGGANRAAVAVVIAPRRVLVLAALLPRQTARLEKVALHLADGRTVAATFVATIAELGAFVVEPAEDLAGALPVSPEAWAAQRGRPVFMLRIAVQGEQRTVRAGHQRLAAVETGLRGRAVPDFPGEAKGAFYFDLEGRLLGLPIAARPTAKANRWDSEGSPFTLQAGELAQFAGDPAGFADARNVPQSAEVERRLAWLGVELQPLDRELAQVHGVLDQVEKGGGGALVNHVFPDSPAARAGIVAGDVLLRVQTADAPQPVTLQVRPGRFAFQPFPWDRYNDLPEQYYDQVPAPWAPAENEVALLLKDFGFGTAYRLDFARDGKVQSAQLVVEAGPTHYGTAPQAEDAALGLTVRELTFETRRYFQIPEGEPGVIVARVVAGSRGSVAGVKPYEIVVAINDQPVRTAAEFAAAVKAGGALALGVRRMHQSRVVNIAPAAP
jgi:S1-C subfamily serine protease